jgi:hypothetical protein
MRSNDEVARYKFNFCKDCPFYECELVEEYAQFRESHAQVNNSQNSMHVECVASDSFDYTKYGGIVIPAKAVSVNEKEGETYLTDFYSADVDSSDVDIFSYDQSNLKDGCIMSCRHVYQVECGRKTVTEGIGDHYKIEITEKLKEDCLNWEKMIKEDTEDRWEPSQPVFISARLEKGKLFHRKYIDTICA